MAESVNNASARGPTTGGARACVFLDRDDTLIANATIAGRMAHPGYLFDPGLVELLPGVAAGLRRMREAGLGLVVVTNQSAAARGWCTLEQINATNARVADLLRGCGVELDGVYTCFHSPDGTVPPWNTDHPWRKPKPGMLLQAAADLGVDLSRSWMIGDAARDIEAGLAAGLPLEQTVIVGDAPCPRVGVRAKGVEDAAEHVVRRAKELAPDGIAKISR